jgi:hypothetical protein
MADNVTLNAMTGGATVAADEVTDGTLGSVKVQYVKLMDGTLDGTTKGVIDPTYGLKVDVSRTVDVVLGAGTNSIGTIKRTHQPTPYKLISAATTNATNVSSTANTLLYGYYLSNLNGSAWRYVKFYNKASAPTVGTDTPVLVLALPPSGAANASFPAGVNFTTGLSFAITAGLADSDTTAVAANEVVVNVAYSVY